jgi:hypothetical protein
MRRLLLLLFCLGCDAETSPVAPLADQGPVVDAAIMDAAVVDAAVDARATDPDMTAPDMSGADTGVTADMRVGDMTLADQGAAADQGVAADMTIADLGMADLGMADQGTPDAMPNLGPHGIDSYDPTCQVVDWVPGECVAGVGRLEESRGQGHIAEDVLIEYDLSPPAADDHRGRWANWGEYRSLPPQRWLHNLEHGGIALLYHPCAPAEVVDELRELARARGEDFRWILTPYEGLQSAVAVVAWEWRYFAECVRPDEINQFFDVRHAMGPENVGGNGGYDAEWIGR